jgi:hypothetical protein
MSPTIPEAAVSDIALPLPAHMHGDALVAYLNAHIDKLRRSFAIDLSWAYARATVEAVRVTGAKRGERELRIDYEYDYAAYCACKDLDARDTLRDSLTCAVADGHVILAEFTAPVRSTLDEF